MAIPEKHQIKDLVALYKLEPQVRDVFVEGSSDGALLGWFLNASGLAHVKVKEIERVDVPRQLVVTAGCEENNRGRVRALAAELERALGPNILNVTAVIDRDFDAILGIQNTCGLLMTTDFASMEMYFFDARCIAKLLTLATRNFPKPAAVVLDEIYGPLQELFLIRLANQTLGWNLRILPFGDLCAITKSGISFDSLNYIRRVLRANKRAKEEPRFVQEVETYRVRFTTEPRNQMHGHDFVEILGWYVRAHGGRRVTTDFLEVLLPSCSELAWLVGNALFDSVAIRAQP